jgi:YebC/PmpR family DNA-binding regulatory protein
MGWRAVKGQLRLKSKPEIGAGTMSGHSKWSTIKRKKAANDAKRGAIFTRLAREIAIAAREGGGDLETNFTLRLAVDKAKAQNMPKDNIDRAIRRGTGEDKEGAALEQILYEGYAPHGVALLIDVVTDNRNRTVAEVRHILSKSGGSMADAGSVSWQFKRAAYFYIEGDALDSDRLFEVAVEAGADDVIIGEGDVEILAPVDRFKIISDALKEGGFSPTAAEVRMLPNAEIELEQEETLKVMRVIEDLEDMDDVQNVFSNLTITEEAVEMLEAA